MLSHERGTPRSVAEAVPMTDLLSNVVIPIASEEVADRSARIAREFLPGDARVTVVHVVQDEEAFADATEEEWEAFAAEAFDRFQQSYDGVVETEIRYGTDAVDGIFETAADVDASAIVFTPRGGSRWRQLMSGDVARQLVTEGGRPVLALPREAVADDGDGEDAGGE